MNFIWTADFFAKIGIICKSIVGPLSEAKTHWLVNWFQLQNQFYFVILLRMTMIWCWWRFTHTCCHSSNILECTHCFWLFMLWFIDENASFIHFFHKIWRWFSSSNIFTQFSHIFCKVISQYIPALFKRANTYIRFADKISDKTNCLSNQTWAMCYHLRNKHMLKKEKNVIWRT